MSKSRLCLGRGPRCAQRGGATPGPSRRPSDQGRVFLPWFGRWRNLLTVSASSPDRLSIPGGIMRRTILLICALMLASCDQGPPPSTPVVKGERGDKGDKGETGDKGEKGTKATKATKANLPFQVLRSFESCMRTQRLAQQDAAFAAMTMKRWFQRSVFVPPEVPPMKARSSVLTRHVVGRRVGSS